MRASSPEESASCLDSSSEALFFQSVRWCIARFTIVLLILPDLFDRKKGLRLFIGGQALESIHYGFRWLGHSGLAPVGILSLAGRQAQFCPQPYGSPKKLVAN